MQTDISFNIVNFPKGTKIIERNGAPTSCFYVIQSGVVRISDSSKLTLFDDNNVLEKGDFFSVPSTLAQKPGHVTAIAETDVSLMSVTKDNFAAFIEGNLPISTKILKYLSARLRYLNEEFAEKEKTHNHAASLTQLYNFGKFYISQKRYRQAYCAFYKYLKYCPDGKNVGNAKKYLEKLAGYAENIRFDYDEKDINRTYPADSVIFFEQEPSTGIYVIRAGSIKITRVFDDKEVVFATLKVGDIIGEMGTIDLRPRSATAIANEDCEITFITRTAYLPILKDGTSITEKICVTLAERICVMQDKIEKDIPV
jgi:CRP-like cAMP-binding protein